MPVVHGRSLSEITDIANNPPSNPWQYRPQINEQLTLYIARVPGSEDIILGPLKPKEDAVGAQDIEASLYYCHVSEANGLELPRSPVKDDQTWSGEPLPGTPPITPQVERRPLPSPTRTQENELTPPQLPRRPINGSIPSPLGPRPLPPLPSRRETPASEVKFKPPLPQRPSATGRAIPPPLPMRPMDDRLREYMAAKVERPQANTIKGPPVITIIRRDPGYGEQLNVATIVPGEPYQAGTYKLLLNPAIVKTSDEIFSTTLSTSDDWTIRPGFFDFRTPWNTECHFSPQNSGRVVRCEHALPVPNAQPNYPQSPGRADFEYISELRLNLPSTSMLSPLKKKHQKSTSPNHRPQSFSGSSLPQSDGSDRNRQRYSVAEPSNQIRTRYGIEDNDTTRLDLSLAREKAGGGASGKKAKLGKLIIEPQGMKMLDLLVAANVAVWWTYDRES